MLKNEKRFKSDEGRWKITVDNAPYWFEADSLNAMVRHLDAQVRETFVLGCERDQALCVRPVASCSCCRNCQKLRNYPDDGKRHRPIIRRVDLLTRLRKLQSLAPHQSEVTMGIHHAPYPPLVELVDPPKLCGTPPDDPQSPMYPQMHELLPHEGMYA